jgi:hypothetical protein
LSVFRLLFGKRLDFNALLLVFATSLPTRMQRATPSLAQHLLQWAAMKEKSECD